MLFGDGAARAGRSTGAGAGAPSPAAPGLVASDLVGDPAGVDLLVVPAGGSGRPATAETVAAGEHYLRMDGREVFRRAVRAVEASIGRTLDRAGVTADDVALFVPHQANARIVDAVLARTGIARGPHLVDHRPVRQHVGRLDPAGAGRGRRGGYGCPRRPRAPVRVRCRPDRGHGPVALGHADTVSEGS